MDLSVKNKMEAKDLGVTKISLALLSHVGKRFLDLWVAQYERL